MDMHKLLDEFVTSNRHAEFTDALAAFLSTPLPTRHAAVWMPPADEAATRLDLARRLRQNIIDATPGYGDGFTFTAVQVSAFLLMPLDRLRSLVQATGNNVGRDERRTRVQAARHNIDFLRDATRYFLQGHHPDAARKKRKTPGQDPQPVEQPRTTDSGSGRDVVSRNELERRRCLARDQNKCIFTHSMHPQVCHIVPFAFNSTATNIEKYTVPFASSMEAFFFPPQDDEDSHTDLITGGPGCSDASWNMLSVSPCLHAWWARAYWGLQCLGIESSDKGHTVVLCFHWMPHPVPERDPNRAMSIESAACDLESMMESLALTGGRSYGEGHSVDTPGYVNGLQLDCFRPIVSGQEFRVVHETLEDARKMGKMVDIQWALVRLAAMSGAAEPDNDDDLSEFDFEREEYERAIFLGYVDDEGHEGGMDDADANIDD